MTRLIFPSARLPWLATFFICVLASLPLVAAEKKNFDIPAGTADRALKAFTSQSGSELVYPAEIARGVKTNAVQGEFTAKEALQRVVAGSDLVISQDAKTGVLTVSRRIDPNAAGTSAPKSERPIGPSDSGSSATVQMDTFMVNEIGQRFVNQDALQSKRAVTGVSDSISQDDIGKLPDVNIADAFRRIPGISAVND